MLSLNEYVEPGDLVVVPQGTAEPLALTRALVAQRRQLPRTRVLLGTVFSDTFQVEHADNIDFYSFGGVGGVAPLIAANVCQTIPCHLSDIPFLFERPEFRPQVVFLHLSADSVEGRHSVGIVDDYLQEAVKHARVVIGQVNDRMPFTPGSTTFALDELDAVLHVSMPLLEVSSPKPSRAVRQIAAVASEHIEDGSCLQVGIGAVPDAVLERLVVRKDMSIHTGLITDKVLDFHRSGAVTNRLKTVDTGLSVGGAMFGTRRLYESVRSEAELQMRTIRHTHSNAVLTSIPRFVSINSAVQVDLTGQVNAEVAGGRYVGAVGGQVDFVRGAAGSPGGRSFIAMQATARGGAVSRIVARVESGVTTTARSDVDAVVTEFGIADLRGQPLQERARRLIAIAAPQFRETLREEFLGSAGKRNQSEIEETNGLRA